MACPAHRPLPRCAACPSRPLGNAACPASVRGSGQGNRPGLRQRLRGVLWSALLSFGGVASHAALATGRCTCQNPKRSDVAHPEAPAHAPARPGPAGRLSAAGKIHISSERASVGRNGQVRLEGHVVLRQGEREIQAQRIDYDTHRDIIRTRGGIRYSDPRLRVTGRGGSYSPLEGAQFEDAQFSLLRPAAHGTARQMQLTPQGVLRLRGVAFTTCPQIPPAWVLRAGRIRLDTHRRVGTAENARIDLHGVPILYLPWVSFPLGNVRKSGFLFPTFGNTSRGGFQISTPVYWNIAPNADFTLQPTEYQRRGADIGGDFRFLTHRGHGELDWDYLPYDGAYHGSRSRIRLRSVTELPDQLRLTLNGENVSDTAYFEDFSSGPEGTSTAFLDRRAVLSYRSVHWNIQGMAQQFQTIDSTLPLNDRPYSRVPDLNIGADYGWGPGDLVRYGFKSEMVDFQRPDHATGVTGWRFDFKPVVSLNLGGPGYYVRPSIAWRATQYELSHTAAGQPSSPSRTLPIASVDTGLRLQRPVGRHGLKLIMLEPRLMYLYVPYRNQSTGRHALPIFDTGLPDLVPVELFRTNRYVGADRVGDANQINAALTARLLNNRDGRQYLAATIGEEFYFETPRVTLPGEVVPTIGRSDLVAELALTAFRHWSARADLQWDPQASEAQRADVTLQYRPAANRVINLGYRFVRNTIQQSALAASSCVTTAARLAGGCCAQISPLASNCGVQQAEISAAWPIGHSWLLFARGIYSLKDHEALERFAGFEYRACCWSVRLGARRYVAVRPTLGGGRTGAQDTGIYLQVELTGLASVGSAPDAFLSETIPGFAPAGSAAASYTQAAPNAPATLP